MRMESEQTWTETVEDRRRIYRIEYKYVNLKKELQDPLF
jgi:hypothetical protein